MRITLDELKNVKTFKEHEEGRYTMRVVGAKEDVTSQSGTEFLQIDCKTMGDDVFSINNRFYNTEKALSILLNFLSAVGFYNEGEMVEFEVSGDKIEAIHMLPGYTHNIINLSDTEDLVTLMWANESFDPGRPDTFFEVVQ